MTEPDFVIELAPMALTVGPTVAGGCELLPGSLFQLPPQFGGLGVNTFANPLNPLGAVPPLG